MEQTKVDSPQGGHQVFSGMTHGQNAVLSAWQQVMDLIDTIPNDQELGRAVRQLRGTDEEGMDSNDSEVA